MEIPDIAIKWLLTHAVNNVELATLSNVCLKWRKLAVVVILEQGRKALENKNNKARSDQSDDGDSDGNGKVCNLLLLPSMVRFLLCEQRSMDFDVETFCIAWFHPEGMQVTRVSVDNIDDSEEEYIASPEPFAPSGGPSYAGSEEEGKGSSRRKARSKSPTPVLRAVGVRPERLDSPSKQVSCLYQWNGYQDAADVLRPFGYTPAFVKNVIELAKSTSVGSIKAAQKDLEHDKDKAVVREGRALLIKHSSFAVRGATLARPEGYCLCWDVERPVLVLGKSNTGDPRSGIRDEEYAEAIRRRNRRRRDLQREVLPRVLCDPENHTEDPSPHPRRRARRRQPCVQFLNVDGGHAVRVFTPPFKPGPFPMPITIFCVAIATEDGCFLSGLRHRFELGHLYPQTAKDKLIERSPICICTDMGKPQLVTDISPQERQEVATHGDKEHFRRGHEDSWNSDDSSGYMSVDGAGGDATGYKCSCQFASLQGDSLDDDDDEDEDGPFQLSRGTRGPGSWHCYAAIFDCESSLIRVDGVPEQMSCDSTSMEMFAASLDGLTIGSDHSFDMSLCFGQGSDGEGEGAISELVLFKGRLDPHDIAVIEQRLMSKHGIQPPSLPARELAQEDQMTRQAHALLAHPPHDKMFAASTVQVPLRYAARHRLVAWRQSHAVTGEPVKVQKIGTRLGDSSSDW